MYSMLGFKIQTLLTYIGRIHALSWGFSRALTFPWNLGFLYTQPIDWAHITPIPFHIQWQGFNYPSNVGRFHSTEFGGLSTKKLVGKNARNIDLKDMWFKPDIKENPIEVPNNKTFVSQTKLLFPPCEQHTNTCATTSQQSVPNIY